MASGKKGLGGGLSNLFGDTTVVDLKTETSADSVSKIAVSRIEPNPGQPRKVFAQEALDELAESIRLHGVITPITVRAGKKEGYYQIIAGERRWRAARQAGLDEIPAMVIEASESRTCSAGYHNALPVSPLTRKMSAAVLMSHYFRDDQRKMYCRLPLMSDSSLHRSHQWSCSGRI